MARPGIDRQPSSPSWVSSDRSSTGLTRWPTSPSTFQVKTRRPTPICGAARPAPGRLEHRVGEVLDQAAQLLVEVDDLDRRRAQDRVAEQADRLDGHAPSLGALGPKHEPRPRTIAAMSGVAGRIAELREGRSDLFRRIFRYGTGAIVAVVCSQTTFLVLYGPVGASTTVSSVCAWLAGAIPNYWINRSWTWGRRGRPSVGGSCCRTPLSSSARWCWPSSRRPRSRPSSTARRSPTRAQTLLVSGTYFLVYALMFVFRFLLFDRLFAAQGTQETHGRPTRTASRAGGGERSLNRCKWGTFMRPGWAFSSAAG